MLEVDFLPDSYFFRKYIMPTYSFIKAMRAFVTMVLGRLQPFVIIELGRVAIRHFGSEPG